MAVLFLADIAVHTLQYLVILFLIFMSIPFSSSFAACVFVTGDQ